MRVLRYNNGSKFNVVEFCDKNKHMVMRMNDLNHLNIKFFYDNEKKLWIYEEFVIKKTDKEVYYALDSIFFSYCGDVYFDTDEAEMSLYQNEDKSYTFKFDRTFREENNVIESRLTSYTQEAESLRSFFYEMEKDTKSKSNDRLVKSLKINHKI